MKRYFREPVQRKVLFLVIIFFAVFAAIIATEGFLHRLSDEHKLAIDNQRSRRAIGKVILRKLISVELSFNKLVSTDDRRNVEVLDQKLAFSIKSIESALDVLRNGGDYDDIMPANFGDVNEIRERRSFTVDRDEGYVFEVIELTPRILDIKQVSADLVKAVNENLIASNDKERIALRRQINLFQKQAHASILRSRETAGRICHDTNLKIQRLKDEQIKSLRLFAVIRYVIFVTFGLGGISIFILTIRQIRIILEDRKQVKEEVTKHRNHLVQLVEERTADLAKTNRELGVEIDERKQLQSELIQAQKLESIGQLAAGIAHEINTPMQYVGDNVRFLDESFENVVIMLKKYAYLLESCRNGDVTTEMINEISAAVEQTDVGYLMEEIPLSLRQSLEGITKVTKIVAAMKNFSHPGVETMTAIDINKAIDSTVTISRNEWKYVAEIKTNCDTSLPKVMCLPGEINQVFLNLIVNAAQAIKEAATNNGDNKGLIEVSTRRDNQWAEIRFSDTGCGIKPEIQDRIFDPFFTTREVGQGMGQGLALARLVVVEKHGGTLSFETETGSGTTFIVRLPFDGEEKSRGNSFEEINHV